MLKSNFGNREKLVPTQIPTRTFKFKFGMQGLNLDIIDKVDKWTFFSFRKPQSKISFKIFDLTQCFPKSSQRTNYGLTLLFNWTIIRNGPQKC
jgi:hypothetical protein